MSGFTPHRDKEDVIHSRANHILTSVINLLDTIHDDFSHEEAVVLEKKIMSSIKNRDVKRFDREMIKLKEDRR